MRAAPFGKKWQEHFSVLLNAVSMKHQKHCAELPRYEQADQPETAQRHALRRNGTLSNEFNPPDSTKRKSPENLEILGAFFFAVSKE